MSLATELPLLAQRVATECKAIRTLLNGNTADLTGLTTSNKTTLVAAINEVKASTAAAVGINDATTSTSSTWSSSKIATFTGGGGGASIDDSSVASGTVWSSSKTNTAISAVVGSAPTALNTLGKVSTALGGDAAYAATTSTALGYRVRVDAAQSFTSGQQSQGCTNLGAALNTDMGSPATDFVALFQAAML